jgi:hydroxymethylpyrimidine/phosphomethylpyrimidine kinase
MTAITAITVQNTVEVRAVYPLPPRAIVEQVAAVAEDLGVDVVKIGMLGNVETIEAVGQALEELPAGAPVVLDPVMVSESGAQLLDPSARTALIELLLPRASVITPNVPEALALAGSAHAPDRDLDLGSVARALHALGPDAVVITGGHRDETVDLFFDGESLVELPGERYPGGAAHGSGCTHSSALAARLAWGDDPLQAARTAKVIASGAVADGLVEIGAGAGPVDAVGLRARGPAGRAAAVPARGNRV